MAYDFDLFVIGGGSGGVRAARLTAALGCKVALAEGSRVGGTCVIRGCVPKKLYVYASRVPEEFDRAVSFGWNVRRRHFDWTVLQTGKNAEVARLEGLYTKALEAAGVTLLRQQAAFADAHTVRLSGGGSVTADKILIACGSRPVRDLGGAAFCSTSDEVFEWKELPESVVVAGGGYIGVELAHVLNALGVETTVVVRKAKVLHGFDEDLRDALMATMQRRGIKVLGESRIAAVTRSDDKLTVRLAGGERLVTDKVLLAWGREPNTQNLCLERAGVAIGEGGRVAVDDWSRTNVENIYAVGDVTGRLQLTPVAIHEAMCFVKTVFENTPTRPDYALVPTAVFSTPEIGTVGLTEAAALAAGHAIDVYKTDFMPMRYSLIAGVGERMLMKLIVEQQTDRVLGCHLFGPHAAELVQVLAVALKAGATKAAFDATMAVHPSAAEELVTMRTKSYSKVP